MSSEKDHPAPTFLLEHTKDKLEDLDVELNATKLPYPKAVFFIVSNEFCERFCYYGMRTILALYLVQYIGYTEDTATTVYHSFVSFAYLTPVLGAMIADSWLGKFKTILYLSIIYACGSIVLSLAAMPNVLPPEAFTIIGLLLIGFGTGGIKPCVSSFGGEQFVVPEQDRLLQQFFSVFYFAINGGSLISTFITPILREDVQCFGEDCYSLAFGVPAMLMVLSIIIFVSGYPLYKIKKPEGNVVLLVSKCIGNAVKCKWNNKGEKKEHWLDYSEEKYGKKLVSDVKAAVNVLFLFIPLPLFWTLFDQQGSRWVFQASRMDGDFNGFVVYPDQIQAFNPLLVMILIPIFEGAIYPLFKKLNILQKPLLKMTIGGSLAGVAFILSALVELSIRPSLPVIPMAGESQLRIYNTLNCPITVEFTGDFTNPAQEIPALDIYYNQYLKANGTQTFDMIVTPSSECTEFALAAKTFPGLTYAEKIASSYAVFENGNEFTISPVIKEHLEKSNKQDAMIKIVHNFNTGNTASVVKFEKLDGKYEHIFTLTTADGSSSYDTATEIQFGEYRVYVDEEVVNEHLYAEMGGVYSYVITETTDNKFEDNLVVITTPNLVNIFWQLPQYIVITSGEIMFSITGLEFAFTQAPLSMKSVLTAGWLLTVAFGNIIVIIIAEAKFVNDPMWEFVLFAVLLFICMGIFFVMTLTYKYRVVASEESALKDVDDHEHEEKKKEKHSHDNAGFDHHND